MTKLSLEQKRDYLIITISQMQKKLGINYILTGEDYKIKNLIKRYVELTELIDYYFPNEI